MMRLRLLLAVSSVVFAAGVAHADTVNTFTVNAALQYGTVTGTVTLNQTTGRFTNSNLSAAFDTISGNVTGAPISFTQNSGYDSAIFNGTLPGSSFSLFLPVNSLVNYNGGAICSTSALCTGGVASAFNTQMGTDYITSGSLVLNSPVTAVTPEPSSLLLLVTGLLATTFVVRSRVS